MNSMKLFMMLYFFNDFNQFHNVQRLISVNSLTIVTVLHNPSILQVQ